MSKTKKELKAKKETRLIQNKQSILKLTESALMLALTTILSLITIFHAPFGGSVTLFSQLPIIVVAYRHGTKWGLLTGFAAGLIQSMLGLSNLSYIAKTFTSILVFFLADYFIAFAVLGLGGIFRKRIKNQAVSLSLGAFVVSTLRYFCHVISGIAIWSEYAEENTLVSFFQGLLKPLFGNMGFWSNASDKVLVYIYSFTYNASYMFFEMLITVIGAVLLSLVLDIRGERIMAARKTKKADTV